MAKDFSCNLGSLNLSEFIINAYHIDAKLDFCELKKTIKIAVRELDLLIDENADNHPLEIHKTNSLNYRNIGLGVMGYSTALFKLGITYGDEECIQFTDNLFDFIFKQAVISSSELAKEKGKFPKYKDVIFESSIIKNHFTELEIKELKKNGLRNCSLLSIAPNGSIGTMLNITGGCEPEFALKFQRKTESLNDGEVKHYDVYCNAIKEYQREQKTNNIPDFFVSSADIKWQDRIAVQAIMQNHVDTAISSTINLSKETTLNEIELLYLTAWEEGLKGITIFRNGSKRLGILTTEHKEEIKTPTTKKELPWGTMIMVNDDVVGKKRDLRTGCGVLHVQAYFDIADGRLLETYFNKGGTGGCERFTVGLSRMISLATRTGASIESIVDQLTSSGTCASYAVRTATKHDTSKGNSCATAIGYALIEMYKEVKYELGLDDDEIDIPTIKEVKKDIKNVNEQFEICPSCGEKTLTYTGNCNSCVACGYTKCE